MLGVVAVPRTSNKMAFFIGALVGWIIPMWRHF
jgi:hypothetical protein